MDGSTAATRQGGIFKAMHAVMSEVGVIGKERTNPQQGYKFRGIDDVLAVIQPIFIKHGIFVVPKVLKAEREVLPTKSGGSMASVRLLVEHTFFAADGSSVYATTFGEAMDSGDKASNKAMSAALKYALIESFSIPTYESDRDTEEQSPELASRAPQGPTPRPADKPASSPQRSPGTPRPAPKPAGNLPTHFGNFGNAKGQAIQGQDEKTLRYYMHACERTLADASKSRFHDKEKLMLAAIQAEIERQSNGGPMGVNGRNPDAQPFADEPPPHTDDDRQF